MEDKRRLKPKRITFDFIRDSADKFRSEYVCNPTIIPVPIEEAIEFNLGIEIVPKYNLKGETDAEAFLSLDLKTMYVDNKVYLDDRYLKRLRFTYAHEIGHLVLHRDIIQKIEFAGYKDWIDFIMHIEQDDLDWIERQASEFAGRLLVPRELLLNEIQLLTNEINKYIRKVKAVENDIEDFLLEGISKKLSEKFMVSFDVLKYRIKKERIFQELGIYF
jgi:Zn-dependent peptidase ImmA (M78 family)